MGQSTSQLLAKLIEIGKAARRDTPVMRLVVEAENCALDIERDIVSLLQENQRLRGFSPERS